MGDLEEVYYTWGKCTRGPLVFDEIAKKIAHPIIISNNINT